MELLRNITVGLDARIKLILVGVFILGVTLMESFAVLAYTLTAVLLFLCLTKISIREIVGRFLLTLPFTGAMMLFIPFQVKGTPLFTLHWGWISMAATHEGLLAAAVLVMKCLVSVFVLLLLTHTIGMKKILDAMVSLHLPLVLVQIMEFVFRYMHVIGQEFHRMSVGQKARGFRKSSHMGGAYTFKVLGSSIGNLFLRSLDRSERIYWAMLSRGYGGQSRTPSLPSPGKKDWGAVLIGMVLTALLLWVDKGGRIG